MTSPSIEIEGLQQDSRGVRVLLSGELSVMTLAVLHRQLSSLTARCPSHTEEVTFVDVGIVKLDTAASLFLVDTFGAEGRSLQLESFSEANTAIFEVVKGGIPQFRGDRKPKENVAHFVGARVHRLVDHLYSLLVLLGEVVLEAIATCKRPRRFRKLEFLVALESSCVKSIPVVSLVIFLIGLVIAYIFAEQIRGYGASIFIVDGVTIAMTRELCPLIVATVMAGRSGSAFTAQIGSMKMNQEIDALKILGLTPAQVLVLPRVLALMIAMPLLVVVGNVVGVFGGMVIAAIELDISFAMFVDRIQQQVAFRHFVLGLIKAPVFAIVIALIGCRMGLSAQSNSRSVGLNTTSTVVQSIVAVIILDAIFAVLYMKLNL